MNKRVLLSLVAGLMVFGVSAVAFAAPSDMMALDPAVARDVAKLDAGKWIALAAGLAIGLAAFGGALGQGRAAASALDGIARNPTAADKMFTPMILGLALIESLVIYALIIAFLLVGKL